MRVKIISNELDEATVKKIQKKADELNEMNCSAHAIMYYIVEEYNYSTSLMREKEAIIIKVF